MVVRNQRRKKPKTCRVQLAIAAVEGSVHPLDLDVRDLDPSPISLDLPATQEAATCSHHRRMGPAEDQCILCGQPVCEDCVSPGAAGDED
jgi:hypothetical protein